MAKNETIKERLQQTVEDNALGRSRAERLKREENEKIAQTRKLEADKFQELKEIINGEQYFRVSHFDKLNVPYDILIHLSAKNTGKTTELYRQITSCIAKGEKFVYGRVTKGELLTEIDKFRTDEMSPVQIISSASQFYFYRKEDIEAYFEANPNKMDVKLKDLEKLGIDYVGKCMTFMNANILGSGNWAGFTTVFFDEIVSYTPKNYVNDIVLSNWSTFTSTILRNKAKIRIFMMGNLRANMSTIPILEYYGIDIADNLRIIERSMGNSEPCRILYVNSGSLYGSSIRTQGSVAHHGSLEDRLFLEHNKLLNTSVRVLTEELVQEMNPLMALAVSYKDEPYVLELRSISFEDKQKYTEDFAPTYYALKIHKLKITTVVDTPITTWDWDIAQRFTFVKHLKNNYIKFKHLVKIYTMHKLYYDTAHSLELGSEIIHYYKNKLFKDEWQTKQ